MDEERKALFSEKVSAGSRTYFFDVKQAKDGTKYLVISESRPAGTSFDRQRLMVFKENLGAFSSGLQKATAFLGNAG
ncbi:MAG: DUF3276 family protein [Bacteroidota bacterium]